VRLTRCLPEGQTTWEVKMPFERIP
jgi:hypothetical protein